MKRPWLVKCCNLHLLEGTGSGDSLGCWELPEQRKDLERWIMLERAELRVLLSIKAADLEAWGFCAGVCSAEVSFPAAPKLVELRGSCENP